MGAVPFCCALVSWEWAAVCDVQDATVVSFRILVGYPFFILCNNELDPRDRFLMIENSPTTLHNGKGFRSGSRTFSSVSVSSEDRSKNWKGALIALLISLNSVLDYSARRPENTGF